MRSKFRWFVVLAIAFVLFAVTAVWVGFSAGRPKAIPSGSVLMLDLRGQIPERDDRSPLAVAIEGERPVLHELTRALQLAANDDRIEAVMMRCEAVGAGWGKLQELRQAVEEFQASGKPVYAHMEFAFGGDYYLASVADTVTLVPSSLIDFSGLMSDVPFFKGTLDKLGIEAEMEHIGKFKSASEIYTRDSMSDPHREATNSMLDSLSNQILEDVAASRGIPQEDLGRLIDQGLFGPNDALEMQLVDDLIYEDELIDLIEEEVGEDFPRIDPIRYVRSAGRGRGPRVAVVYAVGTIVFGEDNGGAFGETMIGSDSMVKLLKRLRDNDRIRAVVLRVDSPGGSGIASDIIWRETRLLREEKPFIVSMSDVAASGGYYIAMDADAIVAQPATLTGSIGVVSGKFNMHGFYDWIGLKREQIKRGENADLFSDYTGFTPEQRRLMRAQMQEFYDGFIAKVGEGRERSAEEIDRVAQGRVWTGEQALEIGLVDALGGLDRAVAIAKDKAGIDEDSPVSIDVYPRQKTFWQALRGGSPFGVVSGLHLGGDLRRVVGVVAAAIRLQGETVLAWDPTLHGATAPSR